MSGDVGSAGPSEKAPPPPAPPAAPARTADAPAGKPTVGSGNINAATADLEDYGRVRAKEIKVRADIDALPSPTGGEKAARARKELNAEADRLKGNEIDIRRKIKDEIKVEVRARILEPNATIDRIESDLNTEIGRIDFTNSAFARNAIDEVIEELSPAQQQSLLLRGYLGVGVGNIYQLNEALVKTAAYPKAQTIIINSDKFKEIVSAAVRETDGTLDTKETIRYAVKLTLDSNLDPRIKKAFLDAVIKRKPDFAEFFKEQKRELDNLEYDRLQREYGSGI
jgi:hypothetical protein